MDDFDFHSNPLSNEQQSCATRRRESVDQPQTTCCGCGLPLDTALHNPGHVRMRVRRLLTCRNRQCGLYGQTFTADAYPPGNLAAYLEVS